MKIGITGGGNPFALNLAKYAKSLGHDVFGIGRSPPRTPSMWPVHKDYRYYQIHLVTQLEAFVAMLDTERPEVIVNFAAQGEGQGSFGEKADLFYQTNSVALVRLVENLRNKPYLKRFIQIGTSELYGSVTKPSTETDPIVPTSPYAVSKAAFDLHLQTMKWDWNVIRPSNAIVEGQQLHRIVPKSIIYAMTGKKLPLHGGGRAKKSYIHAEDLSRAVMTVLDGPTREIYNCGPEKPTSIYDVVVYCAAVCGKDVHDLIEVVGEREGQDGCYWLDSSKLQSLGWSAKIDIGSAIYRVSDWIDRHPDILSMSTDWEVRP